MHIDYLHVTSHNDIRHVEEKQRQITRYTYFFSQIWRTYVHFCTVKIYSYFLTFHSLKQQHLTSKMAYSNGCYATYDVTASGLLPLCAYERKTNCKLVTLESIIYIISDLVYYCKHVMRNHIITTTTRILCEYFLSYDFRCKACWY